LQTEGSKPEVEAVPIWRCRSKECKAWIRDELVAGAAEPGCPLCKGSMIRGIKHLPKLVKKIKSPRKKAETSAWLQ